MNVGAVAAVAGGQRKGRTKTPTGTQSVDLPPSIAMFTRCRSTRTASLTNLDHPDRSRLEVRGQPFSDNVLNTLDPTMIHFNLRQDFVAVRPGIDRFTVEYLGIQGPYTQPRRRNAFSHQIPASSTTRLRLTITSNQVKQQIAENAPSRWCYIVRERCKCDGNGRHCRLVEHTLDIDMIVDVAQLDLVH